MTTPTETEFKKFVEDLSPLQGSSEPGELGLRLSQVAMKRLNAANARIAELEDYSKQMDEHAAKSLKLLDKGKTACSARIAELEAQNEQLLLEDGLMKFYRTKERNEELQSTLAAERAAHLATQRALVDVSYDADSWAVAWAADQPDAADETFMILKKHEGAINSAREAVAKADKGKEGV